MKRAGSLSGLYTMGIAALFLVGFLLLVMFGARTYRDVAANQENNNEARALLSYLSTCVKSSDRAGQIDLQNSDYGPVLRIRDGSGYALRIYQYENQLVEEYHAENSQLVPEDATVLGATSVFQVEMPEDHILKVTTDAGEILLYLRSGEGRA